MKSQTNPDVEIESCASRALASEAVAVRLAAALTHALADSPRASLVLSGGSTPVACLRHLAAMPVPWERVDVTLTDERLVAPTHSDSNERMLREEFFARGAAAATFRPLEESQINAMPKPFAAVLLGMGEDGHFASIFPDIDDLAGVLAPDGVDRVRQIDTAASPVARKTMTLACLLQTRSIELLVFGAAKRQVLAAPAELPVAALLHQRRVPLRVTWAPDDQDDKTHPTKLANEVKHDR